jgi:predicted DsbA family dithiol-disulfide isomerase
MSADNVVHVNVISDIVCPQCWIGKRTIELAAQREGIILQLEWLPYQLDAQLPRDGVDRMAYYTQKFGVHAAAVELDYRNNQLNHRGLAMGLELKYYEGQKIFNTYDAHKLMLYAKNTGGLGVQNELQEILFRKYLNEGVSLSKNELINAAEEVGIAVSEAKHLLSSDDSRLDKELQDELVQARSNKSLTAIPCFIFPNGKHINGTADIEEFAQLLQQSIQFNHNSTVKTCIYC